MNRKKLFIIPMLLLVLSLIPSRLVAEDESYLLSDNEFFKYIPGPGLNLYEWEKGNIKLKIRGFGEEPSMLCHVVTTITNHQAIDLDGDSRLWVNTKLGGDFVIRKWTPKEKVINELGSVLLHELKVQITFEYKNVVREVYVARGTFQAAPIGTEWKPKVKSYAVYGKEGPAPDKRHSVSGAGKFPEFLKAVGFRVGCPIVSDVKDPPKEYFGWQVYLDEPERTRWDEFPKQFAKNPQLVLKHVAEQTGLTFHKEKREVRLLFLKEKK